MRNIITNINETDRNFVFSPIAVYYALCLLAQTAAGETKKEILDVLEVSEEELLSRTEAIRNAFNVEEEETKLSLNSSLWLNNSRSFKEDVVNQICKDNDSTIEIGAMGDEDFNNKLHDWLNKNTGNLLEDNVGNIQMSADTIMELFSAIYLKGKWADNFEKNRTENRTFFINEEEKIECEFMNRLYSDFVLCGEHFKAIRLPILGIGSMLFILPNEGYKPSDINNDEDLICLLEGKEDCVYGHDYHINLSLPKFDIKADGDLLAQLNKLGIRKAMDIYEADFAPITDEKEVCLAKANQASRLKIDESGIEAASYVEMAILIKGIPFMASEEIDLIFNRPFMFAVEHNRMPLFIGTIKNPNENKKD
ncbi:MAG: serpin family protein [Erysipelotrichaceae bacterium]|nr:serpin family protein [Erysipelotrichaceae bacterium]